jgi:hypothetical protein
MVYGLPTVTLCILYGYNPLSHLWLLTSKALLGPKLYTPSELAAASTGDHPLLV